MDISDIVKDLIQEHHRYILECEKNSTEIEKQRAIIKAKTKELQMYTELAQKHFQYKIQERERLFKSASSVLEKAMQIGDIDIAQIAIRTIEVVHNKSPFSF